MAATRELVASALVDAGLIAIVRATRAQGVVEACRALVNGGLRVVEITMTTPGALEAIQQAADTLGERCIIGVGSVRDAATVAQAVDAGAQFIVSPITVQSVIDASHERGKPVMAGALTPNEIAHAQQSGADLVKVFPANYFGPRYFKDVLAPMPELRLTPTGGVTLENVGQWFAAGALSVGVGSSLVRGDLIEAGDWAGLSSLAEQYVQAVQAAKGEN